MNYIKRILFHLVLVPVRVVLWIFKKLLNMGSYVYGAFLLFVAGCLAYCILEAKWQSALILTAIGGSSFLILFLLVWTLVQAEKGIRCVRDKN